MVELQLQKKRHLDRNRRSCSRLRRQWSGRKRAELPLAQAPQLAMPCHALERALKAPLARLARLRLHFQVL